jgi:hypothetical protein
LIALIVLCTTESIISTASRRFVATASGTMASGAAASDTTASGATASLKQRERRLLQQPDGGF